MKLPINILVDNLGPNQLAYEIIISLNNVRPSPFILFYQNFLPYIAYPNFTIMHISEAWGQKGYTIATCLNTAKKLTGFPNISSKYLYVYNTEWLRGKQRVYDIYKQIYCDQQLKLIARSELHAKAILNNFNREVEFIMPHFNPQTIISNICKS